MISRFRVIRRHVHTKLPFIYIDVCVCVCVWLVNYSIADIECRSFARYSTLTNSPATNVLWIIRVLYFEADSAQYVQASAFNSSFVREEVNESGRESLLARGV